MSDPMNKTTSTSVPEVNTRAGNNNVSQQQQESVAAVYTLPHYATEVDAVHESIQKAIDLVQHYSEQADYVDDASASNNNNTSTNNNTSSSFTTTDPDEIYQQLDTARNQITESWQALYTSFHSKNDDDDNEDNVNRGNPLSEQEQIRIAYLNMITDSFGNVLANLHGGDTNNNVNVDVLTDCLQSGYDLLTQFNASSSTTWYENDFVWNDDDDDHMDDDGFDNDDDNDDDVVTPHERHRQQLGFQEVH